MFLYDNKMSEDDLIYAQDVRNLHFLPHIHKSCEFILSVSGSFSAVVDNTAYSLSPGEALFIMPNVIHGYSSPQASLGKVIIFDTKYVSDFIRSFGNERPTYVKFRPDKYLIEGIDRFWTEQNHSRCNIKALLYLICSEYEASMTQERKKTDKSERVLYILDKIRTDFNSPLKLDDLAKESGYDYYYISKLFKSVTGITFCRYLAQYRVQYACRLIEEGDNNITEIAMQSGFGSIRSFNRIFMDITGKTPSEWSATTPKNISPILYI